MNGSPLVSVVQEAASPKAEVRLHAAALLASLGGPEAEEALAGLLADPDHRVRARAVAGLAGAGPGGRVPCAALLVDASSGAAGIAAARVLAASPEGGDVLLEALAHGSPTVRLRAARELPSPPGGAGIVAVLEAAARAESDPDVEAELLLALGRTRRGDAAPSLLRALRNGTPHARAHAAWALGVLGDPRAAARLLPVLDEPGVGACAMSALALLAAPEAAEELARRGARGAGSADLLLALARSVASGSPALARRVRILWPGVTEAAQALLSGPSLPRATAGALARLLARLDAAGAAGVIVRQGPFPDGYAPLGRPSVRASRGSRPDGSGRRRSRTRAHAAPPRRRARGGVRACSPTSTRARRPALSTGSRPAPPRSRTFSRSSRTTTRIRPSRPRGPSRARRAGRRWERARAAATALHDRASGPDGPGRAAALMALRGEAGAAADVALRAAFASRDPGSRAAAVSAASGRTGIADRDVFPLLDDEDASVRAEALWSLGRLARVRRSGLEARHVRRFLNDEAQVAAAVGALLVTLAGADRSRVARELLAQRGAVRRSAMEAVADARDSAAASAVAFAVLHEDASTARAVLEAAAVAPPHVAAEALAAGLADGRPEVRIAAASAAAHAGDDLAAALAAPLAEALDRESDAEAGAALLRAAASAGRAEAIPAVTRALVADAGRAEARDAARALARRFPEAVRGAWASAPPRAGRAWGAAIEAARLSAGADEIDDAGDALRLMASLARRRTGLSLDPEVLRPRLALLLAAEAWAAGSFRLLWRRTRDLPVGHPLFARLVDSVADTSSRFFADPGALEALAGEIAPERLLSLGPDGTLEVWCVGCGTGEVVWSVAIRLADRGLVGSRRVRIRGTDLSPAAIRQARAGVYGPHALRGVADAVRNRHFQALSNGRYRVREALRDSAFFEARALADEPAGAGKHDVILCDGLLPQIPADARAQAVEHLGACLKPGGYLLLGREDHVAATAAPLAPVLLGSDLAYRRPGAVVYTRAL